MGSRTLGNISSYLLTPLSIFLNYKEMDWGLISKQRFWYRTAGDIGSFAGGAAIGFAFGGPIGLIAGGIISGSFFIGEKVYDGYNYFSYEVSKYCSDFNAAVSSGSWFPIKY